MGAAITGVPGIHSAAALVFLPRDGDEHEQHRHVREHGRAVGPGEPPPPDHLLRQASQTAISLHRGAVGNLPGGGGAAAKIFVSTYITHVYCIFSLLSIPQTATLSLLGRHVCVCRRCVVQPRSCKRAARTSLNIRGVGWCFAFCIAGGLFLSQPFFDWAKKIDWGLGASL